MSRAKAVIILRNPSTGERAGRLSAGGKNRRTAVAAVKRLAAKLGIPVSGGKGRNPELLETIRPGDRVTIRTPQGQTRSGRAVMRGPAGWVLNLGGRYGTPGIANDRNLVSVRKAGGKRRDSLAMRRLTGNPRGYPRFGPTWASLKKKHPELESLSASQRRDTYLKNRFLYKSAGSSEGHAHRQALEDVALGRSFPNPGRRGNVTAYGSVVRGANFQQEWYETASGDAKKRAAQLRKAGFRVTVQSMGSQVTPVGTVKMSLVTIHNTGRDIPPPERVVRLNPPRGMKDGPIGAKAAMRFIKAAGGWRLPRPGYETKIHEDADKRVYIANEAGRYRVWTWYAPGPFKVSA